LEEIEKVLNFIIEIEKLKDVHRKTMPVGLDRFENSAEHSWHVCLSALMLSSFANEPINIDRVIKMLLIHDLGEIDAGDTLIYASETDKLKAEETAGIRRIFSNLPNGMVEEFMDLWNEFESGETPDSKFAKAIDRVPPLLHNIHGGGHSWKQHGITKDQVFSLNQRIEKGSDELWSVIRNKLEDAVNEGILK
jgi:putative hydrolase of HD superfamily